jgi:hypothetical protein
MPVLKNEAGGFDAVVSNLSTVEALAVLGALFTGDPDEISARLRDSSRDQLLQAVAALWVLRVDGVQTMMGALVLELADRGIQVAAVTEAPGPELTPTSTGH